MKTQYKILLITAVIISITIPTINAVSQKPIDATRCFESTPYPTVDDAVHALGDFMDENYSNNFVGGSVNFPPGMHSQNRDLPTTITLCLREASTFEQ